jgi:hypothetical protein
MVRGLADPIVSAHFTYIDLKADLDLSVKLQMGGWRHAFLGKARAQVVWLTSTVVTVAAYPIAAYALINTSADSVQRIPTATLPLI